MGKHAFVTGASAGIGEGLCYALSRAGYHVTLCARREAELARVASNTSDRVTTFVLPGDMTDLDALPSLLQRAEDELGPIDVLVNNAGVQIVEPTAGVDPSAGERLFAINVLAPFRLTRAVLPKMIARRQGTIVDIASLAALAPTPGMYHYNASKAALAAASESLRAEVKEHDLHVVTVYPGPVDTQMARDAVDAYEGHAADRLPMGTTSELADLILSAIDKRQPRVIYPRAYTAARHFPQITRWVVDTFAPKPK